MEPQIHRRTLSPAPSSVAVLLLLAASGCVMGGQMSNPAGPSSVIELEEIEASSAPNAYDLVYQSRPMWLRGRGSTNLRGGAPVLPVVYLGRVRQGSVQTLRGIATTSLLELRFVDAPSATQRYGDGHSGGVIEVVIRRR